VVFTGEMLIRYIVMYSVVVRVVFLQS